MKSFPLFDHENDARFFLFLFNSFYKWRGWCSANSARRYNSLSSFAIRHTVSTWARGFMVSNQTGSSAHMDSIWHMFASGRNGVPISQLSACPKTFLHSVCRTHQDRQYRTVLCFKSITSWLCLPISSPSIMDV